MREDPLAGYFNKGGSVQVTSGDTLSKIAKQNNTTVSALASLNNIEDVNKIYAGQTLKLPSVSKTTKAESVKPKPAPVAETHVMPDGTVMAGAKHSDSSGVLPQDAKAEAPRLSMPDINLSELGRGNTTPEADLSEVPRLSMPDMNLSELGRGNTTPQPNLSEMPDIAGNLKGLFTGGQGRTSENTQGATSNAPPRNQVLSNLLGFLNPFQGDKTEADYNANTLKGIKHAAVNAYKAGRPNIDYGDYNLAESNVRGQVGLSGQRDRDGLMKRALLGGLTPTEEAAFSIGGGGVHVKDGNLYATDKYDFDDTDKEASDAYGYLRKALSYVPGNEYETSINLGSLESLGLPPQYKYSGGPVNFGNMNFNPFDPNFDWDAFLNPEEEVEEVEEVIEEEPEVQYESVKQYETKPTGFRYQEGKTPFEMVDQEVVPPVEEPIMTADLLSMIKPETNIVDTPPPNPTTGYTPQTPYTTYQSGQVVFGNQNSPLSRVDARRFR